MAAGSVAVVTASGGLTVRFIVNGRLAPGVGAKDLILAEPEAVDHIKGISITQKEEFVAKPFESEIERAEPAKARPASEACYSCHLEHGAVDTTFVQFYPTLLEIATQKGTLAAGTKH